MNENEVNEYQAKEYQAPEVFELGQAGDLTHGRGDDWPDSLNNKWVFVP